MKDFKTLKKQAGEIVTTVIVIGILGGMAIALTNKLINNVKGNPSYIAQQKLQNGEGETMTPAEIGAAQGGPKVVADAAKILGAGGTMINSSIPGPVGADTVITTVADVCIGKMVDRGMSEAPRPSSSKPLPTDVTTSIPGCTSGVFSCGNGTVICASKVCNRTNDCGDNSDEGTTMCGQAQSCCQVTNGCPGETASSCASSCCCCPYGQVCDRANPARGCIAG
jgi:hypothetical protein